MSKRQKKLPETENMPNTNNPRSYVNQASSKSRGPGRPPRRSVGKSSSYSEKGDPDSESESQFARCQVVDGEDEFSFGDFELAAQAMHRLPKRRITQRTSTQTPIGKEIYPRNNPLELPAADPRIIKMRRKSSWLARKKAEDSDNVPAEISN